MLYAVQDADGEIKFGKHSRLPIRIGDMWQRHDMYKRPLLQGLELAEDWESAIVTKDMWENDRVKSKTIDSLQSKHKHVEMIALCAEFAQTMKNPMTVFQYKGVCDKEWQNIPETVSVIFYEVNEYRLKPKTKIINGVEIPDLPFTPKVDESYFVVDLTLNSLYDVYMCLGSSYNYTKLLVDRGLVYPCTEEGKQAAILHAKALLNIIGE